MTKHLSKGLHFIDWRGLFYKWRPCWICISWHLTKCLSKGLHLIHSQGLFDKTKTTWNSHQLASDKVFEWGSSFYRFLFYKTKTLLILHLFTPRNTLVWFLNCLYLKRHKKNQGLDFLVYSLWSSFSSHPLLLLHCDSDCGIVVTRGCVRLMLLNLRWRPLAFLKILNADCMKSLSSSSDSRDSSWQFHRCFCNSQMRICLRQTWHSSL